MKPNDVLVKHSAEIQTELIHRLEVALASLVGDFDVRGTGRGGFLSVHVEEGSGIHLGASIYLDIVLEAWRKPFKSPEGQDAARQAGRYVFDGVEIKSSINLPALNIPSQPGLEVLDRAQAFTRVILGAQAWVEAALRRRIWQLGTDLLDEGPR